MTDILVIKLGLGQSAEPHKCGSCQFFRHRQPVYDTMGICSVKLPPWVRKKGDDPKDLNEVDPRTVRDIDGCQLYVVKNVEGKPVQFEQNRVWLAGQDS